MVAWMSNLKKLAPPPFTTLKREKYVAGDFGKPGYYEQTGPPIEVKLRRLTGTEKVAAGVDTAVRLYRCWTDDAKGLTEAETVRTDEEGDLDVTSIVSYPERGITIIEAKKVG